MLNNFGYTHFSMGEPERARGYYVEAAALLGSVAEWTVESYALQNIGVLDAEGGELVSASAAFERILELLPASKPAERANVLDNLGATQRLLGDTEQLCKPSRRRSRCSKPWTTRPASDARCGASARRITRSVSSTSPNSI